MVRKGIQNTARYCTGKVQSDVGSQTLGGEIPGDLGWNLGVAGLGGEEEPQKDIMP